MGFVATGLRIVAVAAVFAAGQPASAGAQIPAVAGAGVSHMGIANFGDRWDGGSCDPLGTDLASVPLAGGESEVPSVDKLSVRAVVEGSDTRSTPFYGRVDLCLEIEQDQPILIGPWWGWCVTDPFTGLGRGWIHSWDGMADDLIEPQLHYAITNLHATATGFTANREMVLHGQYETYWEASSGYVPTGERGVFAGVLHAFNPCSYRELMGVQYTLTPDQV